MVFDVIVVVAVTGAAAANKGLVVCLVLVLALALVLRPICPASLGQVLVDIEAAIVALPDIAELSQRAEDRPLQFVEIMVEHVGLLCELMALLGDCELNLADHLSILDSHHYVMRASLKSVGHLYHPELLGFAQFEHLVVDLDDFPLS